MQLPRVLIYGQPFNNRHGGGITLSNLFKGWDKDKIAVADTGHMMDNVTTDICNTYYQLGSDDFKWRFPFNYIQRKFPSGLKSFSHPSVDSTTQIKKGLRFVIVNGFFFPVLEWLGLFHSVSKITLSLGFKEWLSAYKPEVLYIQVSTRESVLFATDLVGYLRIPSVIHFMDDWPSTVSRRGLFKKYWARRIDRELRIFLNKIDLFLSISDSMSTEYVRRYGKMFLPFHNPIDIDKFARVGDKQVRKTEIFSILYMGRIGIANKNSIYSFAEAISWMSLESCKVSFDIFTPDIDSRDLKRIQNLHSVRILPPVKHEEVPSLLSNYDLLLLPLDFTESGLKYAQYSIPTKASEYMISGIPVLVYAPEETAISEFFRRNECGICVTNQDQNELANAIQLIINDEEFKVKISNNAVHYAKEKFDALKVREEFQNLLINLKKAEKNVH